MSSKSQLAAFAPGGFAGDPAAPASTRALKRRVQTPGMASRQRLTSAQSAVGVQMLTPDQSEFRARAIGRWAADQNPGAQAPAYKIHKHSDGTTDVTRLEPNGSEYIDLGGRGATDVAVGRRP
jgi:hypothetical protein